MAPRVDDLRLGQYQVYQARVHVVVGVLVGKERALAAIPARAPDVFPAKPPETAAVDVLEVHWVAGVEGAGDPVGPYRHAEVAQLVGPIHHRVARQDLLDQR